MGKFIVIAFAFLTLAFYELSDGADFDSDALRSRRVEAGPIKQGLPKISDVGVTEETPEIVAKETVTNLVSDEKIDATVSAVLIEDAVDIEVTQASLVIEAKDENTSSIILPRLIEQPEAIDALSSTQGSDVLDVRTVTSNSVNVRGGPGTDYEVVGRLTRGAEVEVLIDDGNGWVEMRSMDGDTFGWMAIFLLSDR